MTAVEDLDQWQRKTVGLTTSIDLVNLERHAQVPQERTLNALKERTKKLTSQTDYIPHN